ncbi:MAG: 30S ribosome-binding factor RbfA [Deltaproteobacteria bacterium]|nr:30S ribosome-binding factor RbfA [Deltaproteobacteria bacterium]
MKPWSRGDRVGHLVQRILAERLARGTSIPELEGVVITGVRMSPDVRIATVWFQVMDAEGTPGKAERTLAGLEAARRMLQEELRRQMTIKFVPTLRFEHDSSLDRIQRLESIFQELDEARRAGGGGEGPADEG